MTLGGVPALCKRDETVFTDAMLLLALGGSSTTRTKGGWIGPRKSGCQLVSDLSRGSACHRALQQLLVLVPGLPQSFLKVPLPGTWLEVLDVAEEHAKEHRGRSLQRGLVMSISPLQRMPYLSRKAAMASHACRPAACFTNSFKKLSSLTCYRMATTSGCGRITSATSSSMTPVTNQEIHNDRQANDGRLSHQGREQIRGRQERGSRHIREQKHDGQREPR